MESINVGKDISTMETIAAIATPPGKGALAIVRISGSEALQIIEKIIKEKKRFKKADYGFITKYHIEDQETNEIIDEVTVIKYKEPRSYTGENSVEIIAHGGYYCVKKIMEQIIKNGARIAQKGEFSQRAFLNGKMDLMKAEAINALIESRDDKEYKSAINSYQAGYNKINEWVQVIKNELMHIEAEIEFGEDENICVRNDDIIKNLIVTIKNEIERIKTIKKTRKIPALAITGPTNAGKSTLFNYLLGYKRSIVHEKHGTTRDIIGERIEIEKKEIEVLDTAGLRETEDCIEKEGIEKSKEAIERSELIIWITDINEKISKEEMKHIEWIPKEKTIILLNKIDKKENREKEEFFNRRGLETIKISLKKEENLDILIMKIKEKISKITNTGTFENILINERQRKIAEEMIKTLDQAINQWEKKEITAYYLRESIQKTEQLFGQIDSEEILTSIFRNFCIGK